MLHHLLQVCLLIMLVHNLSLGQIYKIKKDDYIPDIVKDTLMQRVLTKLSSNGKYDSIVLNRTSDTTYNFMIYFRKEPIILEKK